MCETHKNKFFIYYQPQTYNTVKINDDEYDLMDMGLLKKQLNETFGENTLLCFTHEKKKNTNDIFYFDHTEYIKFCKYASDKINT